MVELGLDRGSATVGDAGELLHIDMHQLTGPITLITDHRCGGGAVTGVEPTLSFMGEDLLHRGGGPLRDRCGRQSNGAGCAAR